jgi:hypothetical protein
MTDIRGIRTINPFVSARERPKKSLTHRFSLNITYNGLTIQIKDFGAVNVGWGGRILGHR